MREIQDNSFLGLSALLKLDLSSNRLRIISNKAFAGLLSLKELIITRNNLKSINGEICNFSRLEKLNLNDNAIERIKPKTFDRCIHLKNLYVAFKNRRLSNNALRELKTGTFKGLKQLKILDLSNNKLLTLGENLTDGMTKLHTLLLNNNDLQSINGIFNQEMPKLWELKLAENKLDYLEDGLFKNIFSLFELNLAKNRLWNLPCHLLSHLLVLTKLDISHTKVIFGEDWYNIVHSGYFNNLKALGLADSNMTTPDDHMFKHFKKLQILDLSRNNIQEFLPEVLVNQGESLISLILNGNDLQSFQTYHLMRHYRLRELHLAKNKIEYFNNENRSDINRIHILTLDENNVRVITHNCFSSMSLLRILSLKNNPLVDLASEPFYGLIRLQNLQSTREYLCCLVPGTVERCKPIPNQEQLSTCENLLAHRSLQIFVWIVGILALIGNTSVIIMHWIWRRKFHRHLVPTFLISNLAFTDLLTGFYLIIIAVADQIYHHNYAQYSEFWLRHPFCVFACFLTCVSSIMSVLMMFVITIDRYICVVYPLSGKRLTIKSASAIVTFFWLVSISYVAFPLMFGFGKSADDRIYQYSSVCLPMNIHNSFFRIWILTSIAITVLIWIIVSILYLAMFISIQRTRMAVENCRNIREDDKRIAGRMLIILLANLACWMPFYIVMVRSMLDSEVQIYTLPFIAVFVLPLNSSINPYLYTFSGSTSMTRSQRTNKKLSKDYSTASSKRLPSLPTFSTIFKELSPL
ncbi:uncharacterized protein TRIADDRAFT_51796 [Trichoplax adhaerens]|uniref:G-protein coupled receptors family 1 profile domain-containing protein n=1 Tax=Trichoplax adhaerens TaxID=10228 RepID=B3RKX1_TRIAD|nr:hypothetical protein TRIADDRAFT_51796 [Trichoplax adhaerens]EDV29447.1 hypothetical protein TRIADDRAFT_51796 [Trichoplax adhaerens]|eukprot:XP_002108649.1 hypothetical protein TRIADDRAFT_51796 [Trichoplax adhaerens]